MARLLIILTALAMTARASAFASSERVPIPSVLRIGRSAAASTLPHKRNRKAPHTSTHLSAIGRGGASPDSASDLTPRQRAQASIQKCTKATLFAVTVDVFTRLFVDDVRGGWRIALASRPSSWLELFDVFHTVNLVAFGVGLWFVSRSYGNIAAASDESGKVDMGDVAKVMKAYNYMYFATGWTLVGLSMRLADKIMPQSDNIIVPVLIFLAAGIGKLIICAVFPGAHDSERDGKDLEHLDADTRITRNVGIDAARQMAFCAAAFGFFGVLRAIFWATVVLPGPLPTLVKILTVNKFVMPLSLAGLMQNMDRRFLDATIEVTSGAGDGKKGGNVDVFRSLKEAEAGFYGKVSKVLISSSILDILRHGIPAIHSLIR